ncbi:uncharacterized protein LOC132718617 [Ruditapes philippinarum]|uniref:uncharacterized protein LOC132718617 n=1 Tax=Ruditapes philippinarum TaxID=129788 RepID=UPI00295B401B|nr:uncharacterized protein LOC132718617 [Ruditapes philippinarum]
MQEKGQETYPVGLRIYPMYPGNDIECGNRHQMYLCKQHQYCPKTLDGNVGAFINGSSAEIQHTLLGGRNYLVLFHLDGDQQEKRFAVIIRSSCHLQTKKHRVE